MTRPASIVFGVVLFCTVLVSAPTLAADVLPVPAPVVAPNGRAPVTPFYWTGFYGGAHLGWGWSSSEWVRDDGVLIIASDGSGFLGGLQGGFNYQLAPNWLVGLEGQFSWTGIEGDRAPAENVNWVTTLGPRLGYIFGSGFGYAKGGIAWAGTELQTDSSLYASRETDTRTGWFIGAGIEHALWNQFSAKIEYNYINLGSESVNLMGAGNNFRADVDQQIHLVKAGINYRFWIPSVFHAPY